VLTSVAQNYYHRNESVRHCRNLTYWGKLQTDKTRQDIHTLFWYYTTSLEEMFIIYYLFCYTSSSHSVLSTIIWITLTGVMARRLNEDCKWPYNNTAIRYFPWCGRTERNHEENKVNRMPGESQHRLLACCCLHRHSGTGTGFYRRPSVFPRQYHLIFAPYSLMHHMGDRQWAR
jgi:hypothetical protein